MLSLTQHAKEKLSIYGIAETEFEDGFDEVIFDCEDVIEKSEIKVIEIQKIFFVEVISVDTNKIITIYRTDYITIENRRRTGRWICH